MSGMISKSRIPWANRSKICRMVRCALIELECELKKGPYPDNERTRFWNNKGDRASYGPSPLPRPGKEIARYIKRDVGMAHPLDKMGARGKWRLIAALDKSGQKLLAVYLTSEHYRKNTFVRLR